MARIIADRNIPWELLTSRTIGLNSDANFERCYDLQGLGIGCLPGKRNLKTLSQLNCLPLPMFFNFLRPSILSPKSPSTWSPSKTLHGDVWRCVSRSNVLWSTILQFLHFAGWTRYMCSLRHRLVDVLINAVVPTSDGSYPATIPSHSCSTFRCEVHIWRGRVFGMDMRNYESGLHDLVFSSAF